MTALEADVSSGPVPVVSWSDVKVGESGFEPGGPYLRTAWLPILGPGATVLYEHLLTVDRFDLADVSERLAVMPSVALRCLDRLAQFGLVRRRAWGTGIEVRPFLPRLTRRQVDRLPSGVRERVQRLHAGQVAAEVSRASREAPARGGAS